uniref:Ovule protein n=1 Tax=Meloidogyne hapla TaxID=6305 RepID=A0A1I8AYN1_MELHA
MTVLHQIPPIHKTELPIFVYNPRNTPEISHSPLNHNQNLISQGTTLNTMDKKAQQSMNRPNNSTIEETSQQTPPHSLLPTKQPTSNKSPIPYKKPEAPKQTPCPNQPQKMKRYIHVQFH